MVLTENQVKMVLVAGLLLLATCLFMEKTLELVRESREVEANAEHMVYLPPDAIRDLLAEVQEITRQSAERPELP